MANVIKEEDIQWVPFPGDMLSDDSSFIGNEETRASYEEKAKSFNPQEFWDIHAWNFQCLAAQERASLRRPPGKEQQSPPSLARSVKRRHVDHPYIKLEDDPPSTNPKLNREPPQSQLETFATSISTSTVTSKPPEKFTPDASLPNSPLPEEPISTFLHRLPPSSTTLAATGHPWIYIHNPISPSPPMQRIGAFKQLAHPLLTAFLDHRSHLESLHPSKPIGAITRLLTPTREKLESDILSLAKEHRVTTGKWMLFPSTAEVDEVWAIVAAATFQGRLGCSAKVAVDDEIETKSDRLICIYTEDFSDLADVKRVLGEMRQLGLVKDGRWGGNENGGGRVLYYKCDAYTHLDIMSGNEYKIKASIYNSRDMAKEGERKK